MLQNRSSVELVEKLVSIKKVSKTVKGGKNFSFVVLMVVGDKVGRVGYGKGSAKEVQDAKNKASEAAKKSMLKVPLKEGRTIHHRIEDYFCSARVLLRSAPAGTGVIAGGAMRAVFECLGIKDLVAKSLGTSNPYNMIEATFRALRSLESPKQIAAKRSMPISEIIRHRKSYEN